MTPQEIFDTVAKHLFEQGMRAYDMGRHTCSYRYEPPGGGVALKCAVGCLIPDDNYDPDMDATTMNVDELIQNHADALPDYITDPDNLSLLERLQGAHDVSSNWRNAETMKKALRAVAARRGDLSSKILDDLRFNR